MSEAIEPSDQERSEWLPATWKYVEWLEGVVDKLDKTADGAPIVKGTELWPPVFAENEQGGIVKGFVVILQDRGPTDKADGVVELDMEEARECCSTRKAAEAARKAS